MPQIMEPDVPRDAGLPQGPGKRRCDRLSGSSGFPSGPPKTNGPCGRSASRWSARVSVASMSMARCQCRDLSTTICPRHSARRTWICCRSDGELAHRLEDAEPVADRLGRELLDDQRFHEFSNQGHIDLTEESQSKERPDVRGEHALARGLRRRLHAPELTLHRTKLLLPLLLKRRETDRRLREPELAIAALPHALGQHLLSLPLVRPGPRIQEHTTSVPFVEFPLDEPLTHQADQQHAARLERGLLLPGEGLRR